MKKRPSVVAKTATKNQSFSNVDNVDDNMDGDIELTNTVLEAKSMQEQLLPEEERDMIVGELMDELLIHTLENCYKIYMHQQTIAFTVHCACLALMDVIDFYMPSSDPGEPCGANGQPQWSGDRLPVPMNSDIWAGRPVPVCFGRPFKVSPARYYKSLTAKDKSGHKTGKKRPKASKELPEVASQRHVTISDTIGTEPGIGAPKTIELEKPVEQKKKVTPKSDVPSKPAFAVDGGNGNASKIPMQREQREKLLAGSEPTKFVAGRTNANGSTQGDNDHLDGSFNSVVMETVPVTKLQEERIEMKYWVLPSDHSKTPTKGKGKAALAKKTSFVRKDKKGKPDIINLG